MKWILEPKAWELSTEEVTLWEQDTVLQIDKDWSFRMNFETKWFLAEMECLTAIPSKYLYLRTETCDLENPNLWIFTFFELLG